MHYQRMWRHGTTDKLGRSKDYSGMRFGKLVAIRPTEKRDQWRTVIWEFGCDCGETVYRSAASVAAGTRRGHVSGCDKCNSGSLPIGEANANATIAAYKDNAKRRGVKFLLREEEARALFSRNCHYCGAPPGNTKRKLGLNGDFVYQGIDRVDNDIGYVSGNCVPCCDQCNWAKKDMSVTEFLRWARRVAQWRGQ